MVLENYCRNCGKRLALNESFCKKCGKKTHLKYNDIKYLFSIPLYDIGFFNFDIDFSPFINSQRDNFKFKLCASCGYLNDSNSEFCGMCGEKVNKKRKFNFFKKNNTFFDKINYNVFLEEIECSCGHINKADGLFCEKCGKSLSEEIISSKEEYYDNFEVKYVDSIFCSCGVENNKNALFCENCGFPLDKFNNPDGKLKVICACSEINDINGKFCQSCGLNLLEENSLNICVCGTKNDVHSRFCINCERPLNPDRVIKSKFICTCGKILDYDAEFCPNCGKNITKEISKSRLMSEYSNKIKGIFGR